MSVNYLKVVSLHDYADMKTGTEEDVQAGYPVVCVTVGNNIYIFKKKSNSVICKLKLSFNILPKTSTGMFNNNF